MKHNTLQYFGGTVIFQEYYTASTDVEIETLSRNKSKNLTQTSITSEPLRYFFPEQNSVNALPSDHEAWHKFDLLMEKLDSLDTVDDDLGDDWVSELRSGSSSRLDEYED